MSEIKKFTINNATITIDSATTLQFNHNKCYKIDAPYIFVVAYKCEECVLVHELQGFLTDEVIEPKTADEFQTGLHIKENPFYLDVYDSLFDNLSIKEGVLQGYDLYKRLVTFENESLEYFHLFKIDGSSWTEVNLDLEELESNGFIDWECSFSGMIQQSMDIE